MGKEYQLGRIVSGGQTGVDLAAWDVALAKGIPMGGWVPKGNINEAGRIPNRYAGLREASSTLPAERTFLNVKWAHATLIISSGSPVGGTAFTVQMAQAMQRPCLCLDLSRYTMGESRAILGRWLEAIVPVRLNVAGPRASEDGEIYQKTLDLLLPVPLGAL